MQTKITTSNELIIQSLYLINEYSPNELPSDDEITQGLILLNTKLDEMSGKGIYIPYNTTINFDLVSGQSSYVVSPNTGSDVIANKITQLFDVYITQDDINHPLEVITHFEAYQLVRDTSVTGRPSQIFLQNQNDYSVLLFVCTPDSTYEVTVRCKCTLSNLELQETITNVPPHFIRYLMFALARDLSLIYENNSWNEKHEAEYARLTADMESTTDKDWSMNLSSIMCHGDSNWLTNDIITG